MALSIARPAPRRRTPVGSVLAGVVVGTVAALAPPAIAAAALAAIAVAVVILVRPITTVYLLAFSVPYESLHQVQFGGLNATSTEFLAFWGGLAFLMRCAMERRVQVPWARWLWPLLLFAGAMTASITQAVDFKLSIKELLKLGEMILTYLIVLRYVDTPAKARRLLYVIVLAALSQALLGVVQTVAHFGPASFLRGAVLRASGTFDQPNPFAGYLNFVLPVMLAGVICSAPVVGRLTRPALVLLAAGVFLSISRGALLASIAAAVVMLALHVRRSRPLVGVGVVALFGLILGAVFGIVPSVVTDKVAGAVGLENVDVVNPTPVTWAAAERLAHMLSGLRMFAAHPLLGVGIGNYAAVYHWYQTAAVWDAPLGHAHNYYINVAAEAGIVGLTAFLIVLIAAFVIGVYLYRRARDTVSQAVALGIVGVLTTVAVQSFFDNIFVHAMEAQLALEMGLATVMCRLAVQGGRGE